MGELKHRRHYRNIIIPYGYAVARGDIVDAVERRVQGFNSVVGATLDDIVETGDSVLALPAAAVQMDITGGAQDDTGGTGALSIDIHGLDANFAEISETVTMNGVAIVTTVNSYIRINNMHVKVIGSGEVAAGPIVAKATGTGTIHGQITGGGNLALQAHYTIPAGMVGYLLSWSASSGKDKKVLKFVLRAKVDWDGRELINNYNFQDVLISAGVYATRQFAAPIRVPAMCDIKVSAWNLEAGTGEGATSVELWQESA